MTPAPPRLVRDRISRAELTALAEAGFGDMVKAAVDISRRVIAVGGDVVASLVPE